MPEGRRSERPALSERILGRMSLNGVSAEYLARVCDAERAEVLDVLNALSRRGMVVFNVRTGLWRPLRAA